MGIQAKHDTTKRQKPARVTVLLSREELDAYSAFVASRGGKKSSYARRLILDDMARAEARA